MERTDTEINSFSHWAMMAQATRGERRVHSPTELSWPGPQRGQTVRYSRFPTELLWPRPRRGQRDALILSLSYHVPDPGEDRQWDIFILPPSYYHCKVEKDKFLDLSKALQYMKNMVYLSRSGDEVDLMILTTTVCSIRGSPICN